MDKVNGMKKKYMIAAAVAILLVVVIAIVMGRGSSAKKVAELLDLGNKYLLEQDYEQAVVAFENAIAIDPKCEDAYKGLADAYAGMEDYEAAINILQQGIDQTSSQKLSAYLEEIKGTYARVQEEEAKRTAEAATQEAEEAPQQDVGVMQVNIQATDIEADSVFNNEGYGSLKINGEGSEWYEGGDRVLPQAALVDGIGRLVFPYSSTDLRYRVSDGIVSLAADSPYSWLDSPIYYKLDGSRAFVLENREEETITEGNKTTTKTFEWRGGPMQDGYALVIEQAFVNWYWGASGGNDTEDHSYIIDRNGTIVCRLPGEFNEGAGLGDVGYWTKYTLGWCGEGLFGVFDNSAYDSTVCKGYMDTVGNIAIDLTGKGYAELWPFNGGLAAVKDANGMIGAIDKSGNLVIPCTYESMTGFSEDGLGGAKKDGKWGYIDRNNNIVIPFEYDGAYGAADGLASVGRDGKFGLVDYSNREVVSLEYDDISSFEGRVAYAVKGRKLYIIEGK